MNINELNKQVRQTLSGTMTIEFDEDALIESIVNKVEKIPPTEFDKVILWGTLAQLLKDEPSQRRRAARYRFLFNSALSRIKDG